MLATQRESLSARTMTAGVIVAPSSQNAIASSMDIQAMEENLRITETWKAYNIDFEESGKTYIFI